MSQQVAQQSPNLPRIEISSGFTRVYQLLALLGWAAVGLSLRASFSSAAFAASSTGADVSRRASVALMWVLGLVAIVMVMRRTRRIELVDDNLIISGIVRRWTVPLASLRAVRVEVQTFGSMPKWAVLELDPGAACGPRAYFIPSSAISGAIGGADYKQLLDRAREARREMLRPG